MPELVAEAALASFGSALELLEHLESVRSGGVARVVLVTAAGGETLSAAEEKLRALVRFELPLVFAWEGQLTGPAAAVALAADIRLCSEDSSFAGPLTSAARAQSLVNARFAEALVIGARSFPAGDLLEGGLVSGVTAPREAPNEGRRIAEVIASRGPIATRLAKEAVWRGLAQPFAQALRFETDLTLLLQTTKDRAEGVRAFLEKRPPIFTGE